MSTNQKRAVLIVAGVLILVCTFFFLYQPNSEKVTEIEEETSKYQNQINFLSSLQLQVNQMKTLTPAYERTMGEYMNEFPSRMTQPKAIYNVYQMMIKTGIEITAISPGEEQTFLGAGALTTSGDFTGKSADGGAADPAAAASPGGAEASPESEFPVNQMVGKYTPYNLTISGTLKQIKKALDWISGHKEHMATTAVALTYDSSTGKLSGTLTVNYFAMNGNGEPYEEPDIQGIVIGSPNIFGTID